MHAPPNIANHNKEYETSQGCRVGNQLTSGFPLNAAATEVQKTFLFAHAELINSRL